ncbi:bifunctional folylpolyglutamate synthase/dihydrofolate synthase [Granulicella cerasi]|uniref:Dihydrofolate synthase/folylpolyglutamate synthase n=1 Tax=Granulicella cerasi TaxID=741063 RepID=A0ABW1ZBN2_9BACT|nr:Mur ligase family protein [Granulicella cerasi]
MTYAEALEKLASLGPEVRTGRAADGGAGMPPRKFSLDHIRVLLAELGSPETSFPSVLVAGTNGKGSTTATLASIAAHAGLKTGWYTSPHLLRVNERIHVSDGAKLVEIPDEAFGDAFGRAWSAAENLVSEGKLPHMPSFFEFFTATAFVYFAEQKIELAVLEVGLGGRLDATNAVEPIISVITDIGIDHTEFLGNTITEIAREKAGILRKDGVLVTLSQHQEANAAIGEVAMSLGVRGVDAARCLPPRSLMATGGIADEYSPLPRNKYAVAIDGEPILVNSPLRGVHQQRNLALAIATALELRANHGFTQITNAAIEAGIRETVWPGRLEWIPARGGRAAMLLDVAHNPAGAWTLRDALSHLPESMPRTLLFSALHDKPIADLARVLFPLFDSSSSDPERKGDHVVLAPIQNVRAATVDELLAAAHELDVPAHGAPHVPAALKQAEDVTPRDGVIVVTGSIFLVAEIRALLMEEKVR